MNKLSVNNPVAFISSLPGNAGSEEDMLDGVWEDGFYTVFPINTKNELPQDFPTQKEAEEFGNKEFGEGNYIIETPF